MYSSSLDTIVSSIAYSSHTLMMFCGSDLVQDKRAAALDRINVLTQLVYALKLAA